MRPEAPPEMYRRVDWILADIVILQQLVILCAKAIHLHSLFFSLHRSHFFVEDESCENDRGDHHLMSHYHCSLFYFVFI